MHDERFGTSGGEAQGGTSGEQATAGFRGMPGWCGPNMAEMMQSRACGSFIKKHRLAATAVFSLVILMFVISQVGGILGIIAFARTL